MILWIYILLFLLRYYIKKKRWTGWWRKVCVLLWEHTQTYSMSKSKICKAGCASSHWHCRSVCTTCSQSYPPSTPDWVAIPVLGISGNSLKYPNQVPQLSLPHFQFPLPFLVCSSTFPSPPFHHSPDCHCCWHHCSQLPWGNQGVIQSYSCPAPTRLQKSENWLVTEVVAAVVAGSLPPSVS